MFSHCRPRNRVSCSIKMLPLLDSSVEKKDISLFLKHYNVDLSLYKEVLNI